MEAIDKIYSQKRLIRIGLFGLGKSNLGVLDYLKKHYPRIEVTLRSEKRIENIPFSPSKIYFEADAAKEIDEDVLFLSPSVRRQRQEFSGALARGIIISSDAELFFARNKNDVYAVTGSDGKSTTTYLCSRLLGKEYTAAIPCGNYGEALSPHIDDEKGTAYVCELSSFQLMNLAPESERCLITNITPNHLNWHTSYEEYIGAKRRLLEKAKQRIINFDCDISRKFAEDYDIFAVYSTKSSEEYMRSKIRAKLYVSLSDGIITTEGESLLDTRKIRVAGEHNISNFMGAITLSYEKCKTDDISALAEEFCGLAHRCELVGEYSGIKFINSSIDSSPKRTVATLGMLKERVILILGGRSKGLDYGELLPALKKCAKAIVLTGENRDMLSELLKSDEDFEKNNIPIMLTKNLYEATLAAKKAAKCGDTVLLSPASVSYDEFTGFEERGNTFKKYVKELT